jgi:molecular chaperone HtpG
MVLLSEHARRLKELTRMLGKGEEEAFGEHTLCVNGKSPVVDNILALKQTGQDDQVRMLVEQVYDLAMLNHRPFDKERMAAFLERSNRILGRFGRPTG